MCFRNTLLWSAAFLSLAAPAVRADEGMWLFSDPPLQHLKSKYGFEPSPQWLEHLRKSSVRFNSGGSGSFVSADGLTLTNHHIASDCLQKLSSQSEDLLTHGFVAKSKADERKCVDLELNVLMEITDVTDRVNAAVKPGMDAAAAQKARLAAMNTVEKEGLDKTGMRSDVVTLYNGGKYHLYQYKKYTDVRLVFAPEKDVAFFGGDPDNFEYPRYCLDFAFFRVYENNAPAKLQHYLRFNPKGAGEGELVFVSGHPGRTNRLNTVRHLEFSRDVSEPMSLRTLKRREVAIGSWSARSSENRRRAQDLLFGYQNARKARDGMLAGLQDPAVLADKAKLEAELRSKVAANPEWKQKYGSSWDEVETALKAYRGIYEHLYLLERPAAAFNSELFYIARDLVRYAAEKGKPNGERLREYSEAGIESLKQELFSEAPVYKDFEIVKLSDALGMMVEILGVDHEVTRKALAGKSPRQRAAEILGGTKLDQVAERKKLFEGGAAAIESSTDPMIQLVLAIDPYARKVRAEFEQKVDEPLKQAYAKIAQARFAVLGSSVYPDATFTLRLSPGQVKGYTENGQPVPAQTTFAGLYARSSDHKNREPFNLPQRWLDSKSKLDLNTPYNFVSTNDIIGGNSGSPIVNRENEVVGLIFDGNIQSLVLDYMYTDQQARALSVHSAGIMEALRKVYNADAIVNELTASKPATRSGL